MPKDLNSKSIGYFLESTSRIVKLNYSTAFKQLGLDITPEQWTILDSLSDQNGLSQKELASENFKDAPTISRILNVLERKELIERKQAKLDRRSFKIFLTEKGKKVVQKAQPLVKSLRKQGWQNLSDEDYQSFLKIMKQIFENYSPM